jgi:Holliday junction resolvase
MAAESKYQRKVKDKLEQDGWFVIRMINVTSTEFNTGMPDLLALKYDQVTDKHDVKFIEVKAKKGVVSKLQEYAHRVLRSFGFSVEIDRDDRF